MDLEKLAERVDRAALDAVPVAQLSKSVTFTEDEAYEIQLLSMKRRYSRGDHLVGLKLGFTSVAKMEQMGVHDLIWGRLTKEMVLENGGTLQLKKFIHPRAEPEICFRTSKRIDKELSLEKVRDYVDAVAPAIEIIDSRYENFKFSLEDVIADNCSSTAFVVGDWLPSDTPVNHLRMTLKFDDELVAEGSSAEILDDPWKSMQAATRLAAKYDQPIEAGSYVMAGAATAAVFLKANITVFASVENLGDVKFRVQ